MITEHSMHTNRNLWWGLLLIVLGLMFLLDNMNMLDFGQVVRTWWPALLIIWGLSVLLSRSRVSMASTGEATATPPSPTGEIKEVFEDRRENPDVDHLGYSSVFGDLSLRPVSASFRGGNVSTTFGDTTIDLTSATLADGENQLKLSGVFGDVRIMLAPSMPYRIHGQSLFGAIQVAGQKRDGFSASLVIESPEYSSASKKLNIDVSQVFGEIILTR